MKPSHVAPVIGLVALAVLPTLVHASTAFRFDDLDLRDPHLFFNFPPCFDITDAPSGGSYNDALQNAIAGLTLNYMIVFDPLDPSGPGGTVQFGLASCTGPSISCTPGTFVSLPYTNSTSGSCLGILAGTVHPYTPAVTMTDAPCFATDEADLQIETGFFPITLHHARIAATYMGSPTSLVNGLIRGFLTESDADALIFGPEGGPMAGQAFSTALPGGTGCCAPSSDIDSVLGQPGWWFYWNFIASEVQLTSTAVGDSPPGWITLTAARPNPFDQSVSLSYWTDGEADVQVSILDTQGRRIADLARGPQAAGAHSVSWNGRAASGAPVAAGVYLVRLATRGHVEVHRVVRLR
jgi:hypothetical protein